MEYSMCILTNSWPNCAIAFVYQPEIQRSLTDACLLPQVNIWREDSCIFKPSKNIEQENHFIACLAWSYHSAVRLMDRRDADDVMACYRRAQGSRGVLVACAPQVRVMDGGMACAPRMSAAGDVIVAGCVLGRLVFVPLCLSARWQAETSWALLRSSFGPLFLTGSHLPKIRLASQSVYHKLKWNI